MSNYRPNLTAQQERFCDEYMVSFNAYRAAKAAGYSENTARKGELVHEEKIQEYLKLKMSARQERLEISHDMILRELAKIAFSNIGNYYDEQGDLRQMCDLTERDKAALCVYEIMDVRQPDGHRIGTITKIKMHNKMSALDKIARHLGFYGVGGKSQESRVKNQDFGQEAFEKQEAGSLKQEAFEEQEAGSLKQEAFEEEREEVAAAVAVEEEDRDVAVEEEDGKILTLSPLYGREDGPVIDGSFNNTESGKVPENVSDFMQELLMRGTSD